MRSMRSTRKMLKAEIEHLRSAAAPARGGELSVSPDTSAADIQAASPLTAAQTAAPPPAAPVIAAGGLPLRSEPALPKNLKEAKELLMSMREW